MFNRILRNRRPSPAMVVAVVALSVALGGTGYAATKLPANSVGSKQIKRNAVTGAKVRNHSLRADDFAAGQIPKGQAGPAGVTGPRGEQGERGLQGAAGPSDGYFATGDTKTLTASYAEVVGVDLPAGSYLAIGSATLANFGATESIARCALRAGTGAQTGPRSVVIGKDMNSPDGEAIATVAVQDAFVLGSPTRVSLVCKTEGNLGSPGAYAEVPQITTIKVATLTY